MPEYYQANLWLLQQIQALNWLPAATLQQMQAHPAVQSANLLQLIQHHQMLTAQQIASLQPQYAAQLNAAMQPYNSDSRPGSHPLVNSHADSRSGSRVPVAISGYQIVSELGRGAAGVVYLATNHSQSVAIKVLKNANEELEARFITEAEALQSLQHPNIIRVHSAGQENGQAYMVMDYIEGESLDELLKKQHKISEQFATTILRDIAEGLQYAHEQNILHRDIKPANILITQTAQGPRAILTDFGLAKLTEAQVESLTMTGEMLGTPAYMPPEQVTAQRHKIDQRSDIYSLGASYYEMLTGHRPYQANSLIELVAQICAGQYQPPESHTPELSANAIHICRICLESNPERRFQDLDELLADLDNPVATQSSSRFKVALLSGLLLFVSCVIIGLIYLSSSNSDPATDKTPRIQVRVQITPEFIKNVQLQNISTNKTISINHNDSIPLRQGRYKIVSTNPNYAVKLSTQNWTLIPGQTNPVLAIELKANKAKYTAKFHDPASTVFIRGKKVNNGKDVIIRKPTGELLPGPTDVFFHNRFRNSRILRLNIEPGRKYQFVDQTTPKLIHIAQLAQNIKSIASLDTNGNGIPEIFIQAQTGDLTRFDLGARVSRSQSINIPGRIIGFVPTHNFQREEFTFQQSDDRWLSLKNGVSQFMSWRHDRPQGHILNEDINDDGFMDVTYVNPQGLLRSIISGPKVQVMRARTPIGIPKTIVFGGLNEKKQSRILCLDQNNKLNLFEHGTLIRTLQVPPGQICLVGQFYPETPDLEVALIERSGNVSQIRCLGLNFKKISQLEVAGVARMVALVPGDGAKKPDQVAVVVGDTGLLLVDFINQVKQLKLRKSGHPIKSLLGLKSKPGQSSFLAVAHGKFLSVFENHLRISLCENPFNIEALLDIDLNRDGYSDIVAIDSRPQLLAYQIWNHCQTFKAKVTDTRPSWPLDPYRFGHFVATSEAVVVNTVTGQTHLLYDPQTEKPPSTLPRYATGKDPAVLYHSQNRSIYRHKLTDFDESIQTTKILRLTHDITQLKRLKDDQLLIATTDEQLQLVTKNLDKKWQTSIPGNCLRRLEFTKNQNHAIFTTTNGKLNLVNLESGKIIQSLTLPAPVNVDLLSVAANRWFIITLTGQCGLVDFISDTATPKLKIDWARQFSDVPVANPVALRDQSGEITAIGVAFSKITAILDATAKTCMATYFDRESEPRGGLAAMDYDGDDQDDLVIAMWNSDINNASSNYFQGYRILNQQGKLLANILHTEHEAATLAQWLNPEQAQNTETKQVFISSPNVHNLLPAKTPLNNQSVTIPGFRHSWANYMLGAHELIDKTCTPELKQNSLPFRFLHAISLAERGRREEYIAFNRDRKPEDKQLIDTLFRQTVLTVARWPAAMQRYATALQKSLDRDAKLSDKPFTQFQNCKATPNTLLRYDFSSIIFGRFSAVTNPELRLSELSCIPKTRRGTRYLEVGPYGQIEVQFTLQSAKTIDLHFASVMESGRLPAHGFWSISVDGEVRDQFIPASMPRDLSRKLSLGRLSAGRHKILIAAADQNTSRSYVASVSLTQASR